MNKAVCVLIFGAGFLFAGCGQSALLEMRRENTEAETRIATKQQELNVQEDQRAALLREQKNLLAELDTRQMTLSELNAKVDNLRKDNAVIKADTEAQQKQKERLDSRIKTMQDDIKKYQKEIKVLETNDRLSADEKRKRKEELNKQINAHFKLLLSS
jgi:septal ring factor EnvC (AmiA/AmiB activator)